MTKYNPPDSQVISEALNGDQQALMHILSHYESFGNYLIQANVLKFACVSGSAVCRYPKEDLKQEIYYRLIIKDLVESFDLEITSSSSHGGICAVATLEHL